MIQSLHACAPRVATALAQRLRSGLLALPLMAVIGAAPAMEFQLEASSDEDFALPHDIVLSPDRSRLFVADNGNHRIVVLDATTLKPLGRFGQGELREPHDVAFDAKGRLLVADTGNSRIAIYDIDGAGARLVDELRGGISRPEGVAVHADGRVFASGAASGNLVVYRGGRVTAETGGFSSPHDVAFAPDGSLWLADSGNDRLLRLDASLQVIQQLSGKPYDFSGPRYMDLDGQGRMFVADKYTHRILVIEPDGHILATLGSGRSGKGPGVFDRPEGVELNGQDLWLSDTYNDRIVRYRIIP